MLFSFMGIAQEWHGITKDSPAAPVATLVSSSEKEVVVNFELGGFYTTNVKTPNGTQVTVSAGKMALELEAGAPQLPYEVIPVMIGDMAEMNVNVINSKYVDFENVEVAPSKGNFSRQINPEDVPYTYGAMYQQDAFWPASQASLDAPYIIRDFRGQNILVRPFAYNPVTKTLRVYTSMTIAMTKVSNNGENQKAARKSNAVKTSPEFKASYSRRFINFENAAKAYPFVEDDGEMLVICADQFMAGMEEFVNWKNQSGRPTTMVSVTEVGGNSDSGIKSYITNIYNDPNRNLAYVLFVGDYAHITPHLLGSERSDNWFGQIEGTDHYPEVFIGRFSVETDAHLANHVAKVLFYERDLQGDITWGDKGMGIGYYGAGSGHYGEDDYRHIDLIRDTLMHYTYSQVTEHHGGSGGDASQTTISATLNEGVGIVNYCNHGSEYSWGVANYSTTNVNALTNDYKLPIIWSVACLNGKFNYSPECFAEAWMRATNNTTGAPTGAIGGMFSWMSQPWQPPMYGQDEMVNILTEWSGADMYNHTLAGASLNGNMSVIDKSGDTECHDTWILFGDPSLMVRTANPTDMNVTLNPSVLMIGMSSLEISAEAEYGIATLTNDEGVVASAKIIDGAATLEFPALNAVETLTLTVIGYNKVTEVIPVEVLPAEGAFVSVVSYTPANVPVVEEQHMSMSFKNVGVDPTSGVTTVTLSSESSDITFTDNEGTLEVIAADETVTLTNEFAYTIAAGVADGTKIKIDVTMTCGSETWVGKATITVGAPIISFDSFQFAGSYVPGTTSIVVANFKNTGHYMATNAVVTISSTSEYVTFENDTFEIGTIEAEGTGTAVFNVNIDESCPSTEQIPLVFTLVADNEVSAEGEGALKNSCNVLFHLHDSWGDGWNGAKLRVVYSDGTPQEDLTISTGNSADYTLEIGSGVHVTVSFVSGSYNGECSFEIEYEGGEQIYASSGTPSAGVACEFDVNCGGGSVVLNPVTNLEAIADGHNAVVTWDAPENALSYIVKRNGTVVADALTETTFVDEELVEGSYTYMVIAVYADGESLPAAVQIDMDYTGVEENETNFMIYPNPAENVLNIVSNGQVEYQLVNSIGQVVMSGNANGEAQLNVSGLNGMYILKVVANGNTSVRKVIVK
ncbi:MAG: C25 family cysteine peptidase [Bacteroidales bacterium]|nr:C25 family cysteine peptidase [Bacteroidales bacterium]